MKTVNLVAFLNNIKLIPKINFIMYGIIFVVPSLAAPSLRFQIEQFSYRAHKMMGDHGKNVVYNVFINNVESYLPIEHPIKSRALRVINEKFSCTTKIIEIARQRILSLTPGIKRMHPKDFFGSLKEGRPYTYVILHDRLILTESTRIPMKEKYKDKFSKHYLISGLAKAVNYAGEIEVFKNFKTNEIFVVFDNASGTFKPWSELLSQLKKLLDSNFGQEKSGLIFVVKPFEEKIDQEKLFSHIAKP
jgi:hypothetical protein